MARITFLATQAFEKWCHLNPDLIGVGNSETDVCTKSIALAARGHDVTVHAPIPDACPTPHKGVHWKPIEEVRWNTPGVWVLSRCPQALDALHGPARGQYPWLICQDEDYPHDITPERAAKLSRVVTLCRGQEQHWKDKYPFLAHKVCRGSNGLRADLVREALAEPIERDQFRINYASSPDRALEPLVKVFRRAREFEPRLSLHVYYGRDNLNVVKASAEAAKDDPKAGAARLLLMRYARLERILEGTPGLVWHGRKPQKELYREWRKAGLLVYPCSHFRETGWVTGMEAQALGAVPIVAGSWATREHTLGGVVIHGDCLADPLTIARFVQQVVAMSRDAGQQEKIRQRLMPLALQKFDNERFAEVWSQWANADVGEVAAVEREPELAGVGE